MNKEFEFLLDKVKREDMYLHASRLIEFDMQTKCPELGMDNEGQLIAEIEKQAFKIRNDEEFIKAVLSLHGRRGEFDDDQRALIERRYRIYLTEKNMTDETSHRHSLIENRAYADWNIAKEKKNFGLFSDSLKKVIEINRERIKLREKGEDEEFSCGYDVLLDRYERGITVKDLDAEFGIMKERLITLLDRIRHSKKKIRTDFLTIPVSEEQQLEVSRYLLEIMGLDRKRLAFSTSVHAFSDRIAKDDVRLTTYFVPAYFLSNIDSVLHEGGHSLFDLLTPAKDSDWYIYDNKTLGMHESVSRFYENVIGKSRKFIELVYPEFQRIFPQVFKDVSCEDFYEAVNFVTPSLIRVDADEVTYPLHILIRYELEKGIFEEGFQVEELPARWNEKYREYLGVTPADDAEGVLQDVHWSSDFGYFPAYSVGNFYNAMYFNRMKKEIDVDSLIGSGCLVGINKWMQDNVFLNADILSPKEWIRDITGRKLTCDDYMTYLEEKYTEVYEL